MEFNKCQYWENESEAGLLLDIVYNRKPHHQLSNLDISKLVELARLHNILPLIFYKLKKYGGSVAAEAQAYLKNQYLSSLKRNLCFWREFLNISDIFYQRNIAMVPIKGVDILVRFYPFFDTRSMCDIDILVREGELTQAGSVLRELGYQEKLCGLKEEYWRRKQCHIAFWKEPVIVEVHWGLDFKRGKRIILSRLWERTKDSTVQNHKVKLLSDEDALFCFALHWRRFGNIFSLKQVLDVAHIIKEAPAFDWDYVLKEGKQGMMKAALYFILMQARLFCEADIPEDIFKKLNLPFWQKILIKRFLLRHTFEVNPSLKKLYLKAHLLLYDNILEPIFYLINIPYEQFCKFYDLKPYTKKSYLLYSLRLLYMPASLFLERNGKQISY